MVPIPLPKTNQDRIVRPQKLMSFDPSLPKADQNLLRGARDRVTEIPDVPLTRASSATHT
jgi:hypothetical protein